MSVDLLYRFNKIEAKAFEEVFKAHYPGLQYYCRIKGFESYLIDDIIQEAFISVHRQISNGFVFANDTHIKRYLYLCVRSKLVDIVRSKKPYTCVNEFQDREDDDWAARETEVLKMLYDFIEELPAQAKKIFKMLYIQDMTFLEVADALGLSVQTVRNQKTRAIQLIKAKIKQ